MALSPTALSEAKAPPPGEAARRSAPQPAPPQTPPEMPPVAPPAGPARFRARHRGLVSSFIAMVLLPMVLMTAYLFGVARDQYASDAGFTLRHSQRVVQSLSPAESPLDKERRISSLCGQQFIDNAVVIDAEASGLRLWGWVALPTFSRSQADL